MSFEKLALHPSIMQALKDAGYTTPTPIQEQAIPEVLAGQDLLASAQTGTGKTAAFVLPSLHRLTTPSEKQSRGPRVLVLTPTRELANQITDAAAKYGRHMRYRIGSIVGGVAYPPQMRLLSQPLDILVATPGRLLDHMERGRIDYSRLEVLVLDEADRMLDMGFIGAVEKIAAATPDTRQTLLFSATMDGNISNLSRRLLKNPKRIAIASAQQRHENIEQRLHHVDGGEHKGTLLAHLLEDFAVEKAIVFTATKRGADRLAKKLHAQGHPAAALHGNMNQNQRNRAIQSLRNGKVRLLVATDVAARGLDVNGITHVFNYDLPKNPEDYVHRIGRTGRASAKGIAISFAAPEDRRQLRDIERYTRQSIQAHVIEGFEPKVQPPRDQERRQEGRGRPRHHNDRKPSSSQHQHHRHADHKKSGHHGAKQQGEQRFNAERGHGPKQHGEQRFNADRGQGGQERGRQDRHFRDDRATRGEPNGNTWRAPREATGNVRHPERRDHNNNGSRHSRDGHAPFKKQTTSSGARFGGHSERGERHHSRGERPQRRDRKSFNSGGPQLG